MGIRQLETVCLPGGEVNMRNKLELSVAVAIPTYNRERILIDTIEYVLAQNPPADEVLIIDQTIEHEPDTENFLSLAEKAGKLRWIRQFPPNLPKARNRALHETECDVIIFIDDDVTMSENFVENHRKNYFDPHVDGVAGRIIQNGISIPQKKSWPQIMDHRFMSLDSEKRIEGIAAFRGCNHSVRVNSLKSIGGYDVNYIGWAYREDSDVSIRLWKNGCMIVFDPEAVLTHLTIPTGGCRLKSKKKSLPEWKVSFPANYFAAKHLFPSRWFWSDVFIENVRKYVFRKENVFRPWRLPFTMVSYLYSIIRGV